MISVSIGLTGARDAAPESPLNFPEGSACMLLFLADGDGLYLHGTRAEYEALVRVIERKLALSPEAPRDGAADLDHGDHERDLGPEPAE